MHLRADGFLRALLSRWDGCAPSSFRNVVEAPPLGLTHRYSMTSVEDWLLTLASESGDHRKENHCPCLGQEGHSAEPDTKLSPSLRFLLKQLSRMRAAGKAAGSEHYSRALWPVTPSPSCHLQIQGPLLPCPSARLSCSNSVYFQGPLSTPLSVCIHFRSKTSRRPSLPS